MTERIRATIGFPGLPVREGFSGHVEPLGFLPTPTSVETLRHIADTISGDGAFIMQGILRKAADELEDWEWLRAHHHDIDAPILVCYDADKHESLEAAIDAARQAGKRG